MNSESLKINHQKLYQAEYIKYFLIFPNWLNHMVYPFLCDGERRTVAGNIVLYKSKIEKNDEKYDHRVCYFNQGNPLKWKVCQDI